MQQKEHLIIFDTTLRDGEQSPGAAMTRDEKLRIAKALERLRVDVIEAGFPAASPGDFAAVQAIAEAVRDSRVCGLARAREEDIRRAGEALRPAAAGRIHTFIATSPVHMQAKLRMTPDEVLERAVAAVKLARDLCDDVEFSPEDAGRSEEDFLCRVIEAAIAAGARTINIPDTVGYNLPDRFGRLIATLRERIPNSDQAIFSVHCHNDLGLAVANSLAAVQNGARQVECTINGLGERAGNAALEEIVMAVRTRADVFPCSTRIDTTQILATSKLVSTITGFPVQPNKAIVGANAFAHESGIHQDGVLKHRETYEIMRAEDVGWSTNRITLGKLSGRAAVRARLEALGIHLEGEALNQVFARFKDLADRKAEIFDEDLQSLVSDELQEEAVDRYRLGYLRVCSEMGAHPEATVELWVDGVAKTESVVGGGPVDATFQAIERIVRSEAKLLLFSVNAITTGTDAQGEVTVRLQAKDGRAVNGQGADTDIVVASAKAYVSALNRLQSPADRQHPQL
ncbi:MULTISPECIES: 2-isopropylmalate synthase [Acidithiobacillus]|jgi:2-isopropylmalate synthase|uniref:2-isopropylmalate synthase n=5 Tax=Acidithiobacillus caldus TaxID=33059 RepID=F9ZS72_ACICS|nr:MULTISPECIES: 2-isopropylmalate synthase [Acidithiobacillus]AEK59051.1 2-isopropylmalate synthase [Acidithiobacillus caldus SM-1]AIA56099.1 2-isopropylmalate synthase [Acidithiobacillus caldus ATCC 51756]MBU2728391.1 2-isopropylmalate synthase [Acidithiobacillus caldus]MBU2735461.1 2-isopropylmalate synthase [Acidithiobacillus caldus ATCC 51756]MBU2744412.1 2-isopropylmalate synthase [Acidithiobacillus caldus]